MESAEPANLDAIKQEAAAILERDALNHLDSATVSRRLAGLRDAEVLSQGEIVRRVEELYGIALPRDRVGGLLVTRNDEALSRVALLEPTDSEVVGLHTALHEGIHLLGPDSYIGVDPMWGRYRRESLGPISKTFYLKEDRLEPGELPDEGERVFWESATDHLAAEKCYEKYGFDGVEEALASHGIGFIQRHWIEFLIDKYPDSEGLKRMMKKALYVGDDGEFFEALRNCSDNQGVAFYYVLTDLMKQGEERLNSGDLEGYYTALDTWMRVISEQFG